MLENFIHEGKFELVVAGISDTEVGIQLIDLDEYNEHPGESDAGLIFDGTLEQLAELLMNGKTWQQVRDENELEANGR